MASESFKLVVAEPEAEPSWFAENWMTLLIVGIIGVVIVFILVILGAGAKAAIRAAKTPAEFHKMAEKSGALEEVQKAQQKLASKPAPIALPPPVAANELKNYKHIFFMSHALDDFTWVQKAAKEIESWPGCYCWYCERDLKPGQDWLEGIYDGLDVMDWYILFWSEKAKTSKWTNEEIREAKARNVASNGSKPKITIVNLGMSEWPKLISRSQGSMISSDADLENWLNNLKNQIGM